VKRGDYRSEISFTEVLGKFKEIRPKELVISLYLYFVYDNLAMGLGTQIKGIVESVGSAKTLIPKIVSNLGCGFITILTPAWGSP
jgi:hypothetical protein